MIPDLTHPQKAKQMFADRKTLGGEKMRKSAILATAAALALAGCGQGTTDKTESEAPTEQASGSRADVNDVDGDTSGQISVSDQQNFMRYSACASIFKAKVIYANKIADDDQRSSIVPTEAQVATVYMILAAEIASKYDSSKTEFFSKLSYQYFNENIRNQNLNGHLLIEMQEKDCPIASYPFDEQIRVMRDYSGDYERIFAENSKLGM